MGKPRNDMVAIRRIEENEEHTIVTPEAYKQDSNRGVVIAVGRGEIIDGRLVPIEDIEPGDEVLFSKYSENPVEIDGKPILLVRSCDIHWVEKKKKSRLVS